MSNWGIPRELLGPYAFPDHIWEEAYTFAYNIAKGGKVLAPEKIGFEWIDNYDEYIAHPDYPAIILHKDLISSLPISLLGAIHQYKVIFENDVFFVAELTDKTAIGHNLSNYISKLLLTSAKKILFINIPKTAGTSIDYNR